SIGDSCVRVRTSNGDDAMRRPFWFGKLRSPPSAPKLHMKPATRRIEPVTKKPRRFIVLSGKAASLLGKSYCVNAKICQGSSGTADLFVTCARAAPNCGALSLNHCSPVRFNNFQAVAKIDLGVRPLVIRRSSTLEI